ncbi:MAG TPA: hypothetical protein VGL77_06750 [Armatimonadota bacterium]|jgi:hypothetical protein
MSLITPTSLAATLDAVNEAVFYGREIAPADREDTARWIAARQGQPGAYRGLFAPTAQDYASGVRLFTGERLHSRASTGHILGEEACQALYRLAVPAADVHAALNRATEIVTTFRHSDGDTGYYCCGICTAAYWRHLAVSTLPDAESRLASGLRRLASLHDGKGRWQTFPFYYTLLALTEIDLPAVRTELRYAAPTCERLIRRSAAGDMYTTRRYDVLQRALAKC